MAHRRQTPGQVAKRLDLATPTVTRAATRMEAAGLLHRAPHPSDARLVRLCLTAEGRALAFHFITGSSDLVSPLVLANTAAPVVVIRYNGHGDRVLRFRCTNRTSGELRRKIATAGC